MTQNEVEVIIEIENGLFSEFAWLFRDDNKYIAMMKIVENAIDKYSKKQNKKTIECLKEVLTMGYKLNKKEWFDFVGTKIKELEGDKEWK